MSKIKLSETLPCLQCSVGGGGRPQMFPLTFVPHESISWSQWMIGHKGRQQRLWKSSHLYWWEEGICIGCSYQVLRFSSSWGTLMKDTEKQGKSQNTHRDGTEKKPWDSSVGKIGREHLSHRNVGGTRVRSKGLLGSLLGSEDCYSHYSNLNAGSMFTTSGCATPCSSFLQ